MAAVAALATLAATLGVGGCASRSGEVMAVQSSPAQFAGWSCERIDDETERVQRRAAELAWAVDERAGNNIVALGVGVMVFWPALLALRPEGPEAEDLAKLKGRFEALREAASLARCPPPSAELPAARAAALPVALGDRLVYEERPDVRHAVTERRLAVRALRREEIEYASLPPAAAATPDAAGAAAPASRGAGLRHDRPGNVVAAGPGMLMWPNLLRGELALGQVMAGDIQVVDDPLARARVRAQVVAVGPQQVAGRRFDAVVLELFGDVLDESSGSTRLDGVLVVDRASGVLLRLDLRSAQAPFRVMRRLARVEPR
ncbi:MAG: hypothetical protein HZC37_27630 [Burkholderiales bacterium]|nr:hypothetical protein [Burkholderiales bacterium]